MADTGWRAGAVEVAVLADHCGPASLVARSEQVNFERPEPALPVPGLLRDHEGRPASRERELVATGRTRHLVLTGRERAHHLAGGPGGRREEADGVVGPERGDECGQRDETERRGLVCAPERMEYRQHPHGHEQGDGGTRQSPVHSAVATGSIVVEVDLTAEPVAGEER